MDENGNMVNLAMMGCGGYAALLIDLLAEMPEVRLLATTTPDPDDPAAQACRNRGLPVYDSLDELLENISPETCTAVLIPTSIDSHFEFARRVVEAGYHVLLEKPPVATIQDLDRLIELQRESGKFIAVNFQHLYSAATQQIKERLAGGEFGEIRCVKGHSLWQRPETYFTRSGWSGRLQVDGRWVLDGTIGNPLAHLMAEALYLASPAPGMARPVRLEAELYCANDIESEDTSVVCIETEGGVPVFYCASLCGDEQGEVLCEVETDRATLRLHDYHWVEIRYHDGREEILETGHDESVDRKRMIGEVVRKLERNERPMITVEECRPYVLAWNGAFESAGVPASITDFSRKETAQGIARIIPGIESLSEQAVRQQKLFSELGVAWGAPGRVVDLSEYWKFPSIHAKMMERAGQETVGV